MSGPLIHWRSTPRGVCQRRDSYSDIHVEQQENGTTITWTGEADHPQNVTCPICREAATIHPGSDA